MLEKYKFVSYKTMNYETIPKKSRHRPYTDIILTPSRGDRSSNVHPNDWFWIGTKKKKTKQI